DASQRPSCPTPRFWTVTTGLDPVLRTEWQQANAGGSIRKRRLARMTNGKERKRFGGETPTDARLFCRALRARPRLPTGKRTSIGFHRGLSPKGLFHRRDPSPSLLFPGPGRDTFCASLERAFPAPACPSPANFHRGLVVVPGG